MRQCSRLMAVLALAIAAVSCTKPNSSSPENYPGVGDPLPAFSVTMSDGSVITDETLKGDVSIVVFFGPGCPDCKWQFDELEKFYLAHPGACRIVAISRGLADKVPSYMEENGYTFPYSAQKDRSLYERFSNKGIPSMYITGPEGLISYIHFDDSMADAAKLEWEVFSLLEIDF